MPDKEAPLVGLIGILLNLIDLFISAHASGICPTYVAIQFYGQTKLVPHSQGTPKVPKAVRTFLDSTTNPLKPSNKWKPLHSSLSNWMNEWVQFGQCCTSTLAPACSITHFKILPALRLRVVEFVPLVSHTACSSVVSHSIGPRMVRNTCNRIRSTLPLGGWTKASLCFESWAVGQQLSNLLNQGKSTATKLSKKNTYTKM